METVLNKVCTLKSSFDFFELETPINLTVKTVNGDTYNQIKIAHDPGYSWMECELYFGDSYMVAYKDSNRDYFQVDSAGETFTIVGGDDADNPDVIELIQSMCSHIMCTPNDSPKSLDNKSIEFNMMSLTKFPQISGSFGGRFRIRYCTYSDAGEDYYSICNANLITFPDPYTYGSKLSFIGITDEAVLYYDWGTQKWYDQWRNPLLKNPEFEDFKYTGLENNEEFMAWVSENAKISLKKSKIKRVSDISGCDLLISSPFNIDCVSPALRVDASVSYGEDISIINDRYMIKRITVSDYGIELNTLREERVEPESGGYYYEAFEGYMLIPCGWSTATLQEWNYNTGGTLTTENLDLPLVIKNFYCSTLRKDPEFIQWLADANIKVIPGSIENAVIKLSQMDVCPIAAGDYVGKNFLVSYKVNGQQESYIANTMRFCSGDTSDIVSISIPEVYNTSENYLEYSYTDFAWHCTNSDEMPEEIVISYFHIPELNENTDFKMWVFQNAEDVYFGKAINTVEELLTDVSDSFRIVDGYCHKIKAQDLSHRVLNSLARMVDYYDKSVTISGGEN